MGRKLKDLTDKKFGKLTVKNMEGRNKHRAILWNCICDCGGKTKVTSSSLLDGSTKSCGCIKRSNTYEIVGNYVIGTTKLNEKFYFDLEDFENVKKYTWYMKSGGYVETSTKDKETISLHRLVMNAQENEVIDHKNHENNNCRKENLRRATNSKNQMNKKIQNNNTSGVTGVIWNKSRNNWHARISVHKKRISLGYFKNFEDAVKVRKEAELKYFGEYRYQIENDVRFNNEEE